MAQISIIQTVTMHGSCASLLWGTCLPPAVRLPRPQKETQSFVLHFVVSKDYSPRTDIASPLTLEASTGSTFFLSLYCTYRNKQVDREADEQTDHPAQVDFLLCFHSYPFLCISLSTLNWKTTILHQYKAKTLLSFTTSTSSITLGQSRFLALRLP